MFFGIQLLCAVDPKQLRLSRHDDKIYSRFREVFPDLKVDILDENQMKSIEGKAVNCKYLINYKKRSFSQLWRPFCEEFRELVDDHNYGTLIRTDSKGEYTSENSFLGK